MEKVTTAQDDRLLNYLDGNIEGTELLELKKELEISPLVKTRLEELRAVHTILTQSRLESPSNQFVKNVMRNLQVTPFPGSLSPRNGLFLLCGMVVAAGILMVMTSAGVFDQITGIISLDDVAPVKKYFQNSLPSIPINGKLIINTMVGLNLVLVFLVLDRTILRPFFRRRSAMQF